MEFGVNRTGCSFARFVYIEELNISIRQSFLPNAWAFPDIVRNVFHKCLPMGSITLHCFPFNNCISWHIFLRVFANNLVM